MKKHITIALLSLLTITSCGDGVMDYLNRDTSNPAVDVVPAKFSITDAIVSTAFTTISGSYCWYSSCFTEQEFGTGNNQFRNAEVRLRSEVAAATTYNNEWNGTYGNIANLRTIIEKTSEGGLNEGQVDILGIAQILFAVNFGILTDLHGDIPCSEAGWGSKFLNPKIDTQESIYNDAVLGMLDQGIANLKSATTNYVGTQDILFKGTAKNWIALGYAFKARYLLHTYYQNRNVLSDVITAANNAIEAGFDGVELSFFNGVDQDNPWSAFWWSRYYTGSTSTVVDLMNARNDNRVVAYNFEIFDGTQYGPTAAKRCGVPGNEVDAAMTNSLNAPAWLDNGGQTINIFSKSELYFILAEAKMRTSGDATEDFKTAVTAAFDDIDAANDGIADFDNNGADYAAGLTVSLEEIMIQKYLSQIRDGQIEAYNDIRRCKALGENWIKLQNPLNTQNGVNYWPERYPYGNSSVISNPIIEAAFKSIDIYTDKIWLFGGSK